MLIPWSLLLLPPVFSLIRHHRFTTDRPNRKTGVALGRHRATCLRRPQGELSPPRSTRLSGQKQTVHPLHRRLGHRSGSHALSGGRRKTVTSRGLHVPKLNKHEVNYPVHEKELLDLVESTTKWRHYLHGLPVIVYTDSSALKYLQTMAKPSTRQIRWLHRLQEFDLSIYHIPG